MKTETELSFVETICLPLLGSAQNSDGGWGFHPHSESRLEPTCWALQALLQCSRPETQAVVSRAFEFIHGTQRPDGSWAFVPSGTQGSWLTALACWVLLAEEHSGQAVAAGLDWLCKDWPRDSTPWNRFLARFSQQRHVYSVNNS